MQDFASFNHRPARAGVPRSTAPRPAWAGPFAVLDLETAPDRHAQVLARRQRGVPRGSPLNEIVAASVLRFDERDEGFDGFRLMSWHRDVHLETDIIANIEVELGRVAEAGTLVTFNGIGHDLPVLRMRQMRWRMVEAGAIPSIGDREDAHADVMLEMSLGGEGRWPSLSDGCAAVGFSLAGPVTVGRGTDIPIETEKCERDVVGTGMLFLHLLAAQRRSMGTLIDGLAALGSFLRTTAAGRPHLERLALNRQLQAGSSAWGVPH